MRGKLVDMEALRTRHAESPAIGNAKMNARGDIIAKDGSVIVPREQIVQAYYASNPQGVKHASLKQASAETFETPQQAVERLTKQINNQQNAPDQPGNIMDKGKFRRMVDKPD
jgi:hypothetical protein